MPGFEPRTFDAPGVLVTSKQSAPETLRKLNSLSAEIPNDSSNSAKHVKQTLSVAVIFCREQKNQLLTFNPKKNV